MFVLTPNGPTIGTPKIAKRETHTSYCNPTEVHLYGDPEVHMLRGAAKDHDKTAAELQDFLTVATDCLETSACIEVILMLDGEEYRDTAVLGHICDASGGRYVYLGILSISLRVSPSPSPSLPLSLVLTPSPSLHTRHYTRLHLHPPRAACMSSSAA